MKLAFRDKVNDGGQGICNEDEADLYGKLAWVIDGATDISTNHYFPNVTDARWLVNQVDTKLRQVAAEVNIGELKEIYQQLARHVRSELIKAGYPEGRLPPACSCGIACIRPEERSVEFALVGDVYLVAVSTQEVLSNPYFSRRESAGVKRARVRSGDSNLLLRDRDQIAARRRQYIDGVEGQFVLSNNEIVDRGVRTKKVSVKPGDTLLLCTDGFARLIEPYGLYTSWAALSSEVEGVGLDAVLHQLREYEASQATGEHNYKTSDDACAMLIEIEESVR